MAGSGQHFIPRHFLKPFVIQDGSDKLWMYRRNLDHPVPVDRGDAAKQKHFYSKPSEDGTPTLDDLITDYETHVFKLVDVLRALNIGEEADPLMVGEVAAHLSIRSAHSRTFIMEGAASMAQAIGKLVENPAEVFGIERLSANCIPNKLQDIILDGIMKNGYDVLSGVSKETLARLLYFHFRENGSSMLEEAQSTVLPLVDQFLGNTKALATSAHIEALSRTLAPEGIIEKLAGLQWTVEPHKVMPAILPDCVCISFDEVEGWQPLFLGGEKPRYVVLPVAPDRILVGTRAGADAFVVEGINEIATTVCLDFFLSSQRTDALAFHHEGLGEQLRSKITGLIDDALAGVSVDFLPLSENAANQKSIFDLEQGDNADQNLSFSIALKDAGNEDFARQLGDNLSKLIIRLVPTHTFCRIDGFTVAHDYESALNEVVRGFDTAPVKSTPPEFGLGVAMPLWVMRDGVMKTHFVLRDSLAAQLMFGEEAERLEAEDLLAQMISGTYLESLIFGRFPEAAKFVASDGVEQLLSQHSYNAFSAYFCARVCARDNVRTNAAEEHLVGQLDAANQSIVAKRQAYRVDGNLDEFLEYTFEALSLLLKACARLIGTYHSFEQPPELPGDLHEKLKELEIIDWFDLFAKDLNGFMESFEEWGRFEDILFTNRHLERLLLRYGILLDTHEAEGVYAHIPFGSDEAYLLELEANHSH